MQTTFCEIEAILHSCPLLSLSADPNDLAYLNPEHFLVGTSLNSLPCVDLSDINKNRLLRWQRVEQIRQHFWRRCSNEYLHSLQARTKWMVNKGTQLSTNQFVLIKQPKLQWATDPGGSSWSRRHRAPQLWRLPRIPMWDHSYYLNYQYYQLKPSLCVIKHLSLSVFSCYLLITSYLTQASLYLQIRMTYLNYGPFILKMVQVRFPLFRET